MELRLIPLIGVNELKFGCSQEEVIRLFGEPEEKEELNDELLNDDALVYHYWDIGISFFFSVQDNHALNSVEVDNKEAVVFGKKIFQLNEKEIVALFKEKGYKLSDTENHEWGEKRMSFDDANVDLYFANQKLTSINFGIINSPDSFYYFPN